MPTLLVAGNWKMNTNLPGAVQLAASVKAGVASLSGVELILCPPYVYLAAVGDAVRGTAVKVGAQNMHSEDSGAFTGETGTPAASKSATHSATVRVRKSSR